MARKKSKRSTSGEHSANPPVIAEAEGLLELQAQQVDGDGVANAQPDAEAASTLLMRPDADTGTPATSSNSKIKRLSKLSSSNRRNKASTQEPPRHEANDDTQRQQSRQVQRRRHVPSSYWSMMTCFRASLAVPLHFLGDFWCFNTLRPLPSATELPTLSAEAQTQLQSLDTVAKASHIEFFIQRSDVLPFASGCARPLVFLHVIDMCTGRPLEPMVQSAPAKISLEHESGFHWHTPLVCKLPLSQFLSPRVVVLIEIAERKPPRRKKPRVWSCGKAKSNADQSRIEYKRVAWCFFRPIGTTGHLKIPTLSLDNQTPSNTRRRLQLFEYQPVRWLDTHHARKHWDVEDHSSNPAEKIPAIFVQFQKRVRSPVRCSLHVGIRPVATSVAPPSPRHLEGKTEQPSNLGQIEEESGDNQAPPEPEVVQPDESKESNQTEPVDPADDELSPLILYRRNGLEQCFIPQRVLYRLPTGRKGCSAVAFSPDGLFIAAAVHHITATSDEWVVNVYEIHSGCLWQICRGAQSMLHSLEWSSESSAAILSASEGVALLWGLSSTRNATSLQPQTTWHHTPSPVFVYCAIFMPTDPGIAISGASDGCVRLWQRRNYDLGRHKSESTPIVQWKASDGAIHSVRVEAKSQRLFCGDSLGNISVWTPSGPQDKCKPPPTAYERIKVIQTGQLSIASMQLHPRKPHLLVLTHPHTLLHFELRSYLLLHKSYSGITCDHLLVKPSFSPDGRFVVSGSEDGVPQLFASLHGERMAKGVWGQRFFHGAPILEIAWSPRAHLVAMSAFGGNHPIVVLCARPEDEETDIQHPDPEHGYISGSPLDTKSRSGRSSGGLNGVSSMTHQEEKRVQRALERRRQRLQARLNREMTADRDA